MRVFVYEFLTGGGAWHWPAEQATSSLISQGRAIVAAVCADFGRLPGVEVVSTRDSRLPAFHPQRCEVSEVMGSEGELAMLSLLAAQSDWTLLIAPETDGVLAQRAGLVELVGGRLLSPGTPLITLAANKQATMDHLGRRRYPVPRGGLLSDAVSLEMTTFPAVLKPIDGCGSQDIRLIASAKEIAPGLEPDRWRLEEFVPGLAASVAVLCGPAERYALPACEQRLSSDGRFTYLGGRLRLPAKLDGRARNLALAAMMAMPPTTGYVGIDLVLGDAVDGSGDRIIEINPRLTTSYIGLRELAESNLAAAMLAVAEGRPADLRFSNQEIEFSA